MMNTMRRRQAACAILAGAAYAIAYAQPAAAQTFKVLYNFGGPDGANPVGNLLLHSGSLYGVTYGGGASLRGTVFQLDIKASQESVLYSFLGGPSDGYSPNGGLVLDSAGNLYGTTYYGGTDAVGIVYRIDPSGTETVLHNFNNVKKDGDGNPIGTLVRDSAGNLYGTTSDTGFGGVVYKLGKGGNFRTLAGFRAASDGYGLEDGLLLENGILYGTAYAGGAFGYGTVFQVDPVNGGETVLYNFTGGTDGGNPQSGVISDGAGNLYGVTSEGGLAPCCTGVAYKLNVASGQQTVLYSFSGGEDGGIPNGVVRDAAGNLYGTTYTGGARNFGTVFKLDTANTLTTLYSFTAGLDGENPTSGVILDSQGRLYGVSSYGGASNDGTIYQVVP